MFIPTDPTEAIGRLEKAFKTIREAETVEQKIRSAVKKKKLNKKSKTLLEDAVAANVITRDEFNVIAEAERLRLDAVQVDDYSQEEYVTSSTTSKSTGGTTHTEAVAYQRH